MTNRACRKRIGETINHREALQWRHAQSAACVPGNSSQINLRRRQRRTCIIMPNTRMLGTWITNNPTETFIYKHFERILVRFAAVYLNPFVSTTTLPTTIKIFRLKMRRKQIKNKDKSDMKQLTLNLFNL